MDSLQYLGWVCVCVCHSLTLVYVVLWQLAHLTVNHTCVIPEKSLFTGRKLMKKTKLYNYYET